MRGEFDSLRGNEGFGGTPRIGDESISTTTTEGSRTKDGSYPTLEWGVTISRYKRDTGLRNSIKYGLPGPDGVMEAYLSYIQMVVVQFHLGVQKENKSRSDTIA